MISPSLVKNIEGAGLDVALIEQRVAGALAEDAHGGDLTSKATISADHISKAHFTSRKSGVVAGTLVAAMVLEQCGITNYEIVKKDGSSVSAGEVIIEVEGNTRAILLAERTALNFLSHLSGIATITSLWVKEVLGTSTQVRDTRKTTPGLRELEKYAVRMGGGTNHRMTLTDGALIKDNHIAAAGGVVEAFAKVRALYPDSEIEIEVDTLDQLREVLSQKPDLVLLDNMSPAQCADAVAIVNGACKLEASGGISLADARAYAESGVDYIAIGALTHSAPVFDIGLDLRAE